MDGDCGVADRAVRARAGPDGNRLAGADFDAVPVVIAGEFESAVDDIARSDDGRGFGRGRDGVGGKVDRFHAEIVGAHCPGIALHREVIGAVGIRRVQQRGEQRAAGIVVARDEVAVGIVEHEHGIADAVGRACRGRGAERIGRAGGQFDAHPVAVGFAADVAGQDAAYGERCRRGGIGRNVAWRVAIAITVAARIRRTAAAAGSGSAASGAAAVAVGRAGTGVAIGLALVAGVRFGITAGIAVGTAISVRAAIAIAVATHGLAAGYDRARIKILLLRRHSTSRHPSNCPSCEGGADAPSRDPCRNTEGTRNIRSSTACVMPSKS